MHRFVIAVLPFAIACSSEDPEPVAEIDRAALLACESDDFVVGRPLTGPGLDENGFVGEPLASYVVHTTQIVYHPEKEADFLQQSGAVMAQLASTEGIVAYGVALDPTCGDARTLGVWESEEAMYAFAGSGEHVRAMARTHELSAAGRVLHWTASPDEVRALDWDAVKARLRAEPISPLYP